MNVKEFKAWAEVTESSKNKWVHDIITEHNRGGYFMYTGGESGKYIRINLEGLLQLGTYHGAIPHIGEAFFKVEFSKQFETPNKALARCLELYPEMRGF